MKRTENYKLPQIELEDNYDIEHFNDGWRKTDEELKRIDDEVKKRVNYDDTEIRELINETNTSLDNKANKSEVDNNINELDVKIAENKSLTDSEISKLKEIANTWETFKDTGGTIGGDILLPRGFALCGTINGNRNALIYQSSQETDNGRVIVGSSWQTTQIASELRPEVYWNLQTHQILLDTDFVSNKNTNGFTKLPNGLIMQWGKVLLSGGSDGGKWQYVGYPISFPTSTLNVQLTQYSGDDYHNVKVAYYENGGFMLHGVRERNYNWFAIGY